MPSEKRESLTGFSLASIAKLGVDDAQVNIAQTTRQQSSFYFDDLQFLGIRGDIGNSTIHAYAFLHLQQAGFFQQGQSAAAVGGIIRNGNLGSVELA